MRKNDLIKKLQDIKGNPEIYLYNGLVDDWQSIALFEGELESVKPELMQKMIDAQDGTCSLVKAKKKWSIGLLEIWDRCELISKRVVFLSGKKHGKRSFERACNLYY